MNIRKVKNNDGCGVGDKVRPNFRSISTLISSCDFLNPDSCFLRPVRERYDSCEEYLDTLFHMYREDMVSTLRDGVARYKITDGNDTDDNALKRYRVVTVLSTGGTQISQLEFYTTFRVLVIDKSADVDIDWISTVVCLSGDNFDTDFHCGLVLNKHFNDSDKNTAIKKNGSYKLAFSHVLELESHMHTLKRLQALNPYIPKPMELYVVRGCHEVMKPAYLRQLEDPKSAGHRKMMEFYESIEMTPIARRNLWSIDANKNRGSNVKQATRGIFMIDGKEVHVHQLSDSYRPNNLDEDQRMAVCQALSREFSIISGPPSTGKTTVVATEIVRLLLQNKDRFYEQCPIMLLSFSNPELDVLLEAVHKMIKREIEKASLDFSGPLACRIGRGSHSKYIADEGLALNPYIFKNRHSLPRSLTCRIAAVDSKKRELLDEISSRAFILQNKTVMFSMESIRKEIDDRHLVQLLSYARSFTDDDTKITADEALACWLLGVQRYQNRNIDVGSMQYMSIRVPKNLEYEDIWKREIRGTCAETHISQNGGNDSAEPADEDLEIYETDRTWRILNGDMKIQRNMDLLNAFTPLWDTYHKLDDELCKDIWKELSRLKSAILAVRALSNDDMQEVQNVMCLSLQQRWKLYAYWRHRAAIRCAGEMDRLKKYLELVKEESNQLYAVKASELIKKALVVAVTTTGLSKFANIMDLIPCSIVIVDAAQMISESHIAACLMKKSVEHAVIFGTHPYVKYSPSVDELVSFGANVSMFERLLLAGFPVALLRTQYRIHLTITNAVLVPHIFPEPLQVENPEHIPPLEGLEHPVFFWDHEHTGEQAAEIEAEMAVDLVDFIIRQEQYSLKDIWMLGSPYIFEQAKSKWVKDEKDWNLKKDVEEMCVLNSDVRGKRNKVVVLSLHFSNADVDGFQDFAMKHIIWLTRAEHVLYLIGNSSQLRQVSYIWRSILDNLSERNLISRISPIPGNSQNYPNSKMALTMHSDYTATIPNLNHAHPQLVSKRKVSKWQQLACGHRVNAEEHDGVCAANCGVPLDCGHNCGKLCLECMNEYDSNKPSGSNNYTNFEHCCKSTCGKKMKCGHFCVERCGEVCVCELSCLVQCEHMACGVSGMNKVQCDRSCAELCVLCTVPCTNICPHQRCLKRCFEICSVGACDERCEKNLPCGHPCPGVCSDICPDLCAVCDKDNYLSVLGFEEECVDYKVPRIIQLACRHVHSVQNLDDQVTEYMMNGELPVCPEKYCGQPLALVRRYQKEFKTYVLKRHDTTVATLSQSNLMKDVSSEGAKINKEDSVWILLETEHRRILSQMEFHPFDQFLLFYQRCISCLIQANSWLEDCGRGFPRVLENELYLLVQRYGGLKSNKLYERAKYHFYETVEWLILHATHNRLGALLCFPVRFANIVENIKLFEFIKSNINFCEREFHEFAELFEKQKSFNCMTVKDRLNAHEKWCNELDELKSGSDFVPYTFCDFWTKKN